MAQQEANSKLAQALRSGRPAIIAEYAVTASDVDALKRLAADLPRSLDAVVVSGAGAVSGVALSTFLAAEGIEPVLALATGDRNRVALLSDARGAAMLGVRNVVCVAGDHPSLGATPEAAAAFDIDPTQLVNLLRDGSDGIGLLLGAEVYPHLRPLALALVDARKKVAAGADFLVTEPIFDLSAFNEWMAAAREEGLAARAPVIACVQPLTSAEQLASWQRRRRIPDDVVERLTSAADMAAEGIAVCAEVAASLAAIEAVRGLYIRSSGAPANVAEIMRRAGLPQA